MSDPQEPAAPAPASESALPFVVRIERTDPPGRTDALEAAAQAVLHMLTGAEPQWRPALEAWDENRIRKVVRRARGIQWRRAGELPGIDVVRGTAQVRVFPPVPIDDWPPVLATLQVGRTTLVDAEPPAPPVEDVPLVLLCPDADMTTGKAMAQAAHAAQLAWRRCSPAARDRWQDRGFELAVRNALPAQWRAAVAAGAVVVHDAGFTEVEPGTATALCVLPASW